MSPAVTVVDTVWHPLPDLRGVGPALAAELSRAGYHYCEDLLGGAETGVAADVDMVAGLTGVQALDELIPQAKLLRLPIPTERAVALLDAGLRSYEALMWLPPAVFGAGGGASAADSAASLDAARRAGTGTVLVCVHGPAGDPVPGAVVEAVNPTVAPGPHAWRWTANEHGRVLCEYLDPARRVELVVCAAGHTAAVLSLPPSAGRHRVRVDLAAGDGSAITIEETVDGVRLPDHGTPVDRVELDDPAELDTVGTFVVTAVGGDRVRLSSLLWHRAGAVTVQQSAQWPVGALPGVSVGTVVTRAGAGFTALAGDWRAWRAAQRREVGR